MVQIKEADRDVLRFLWIDETDNTNRNIAVKRFNRVLFGVTSSSFCWNQQSDTKRLSMKLMIPSIWALQKSKIKSEGS